MCVREVSTSHTCGIVKNGMVKNSNQGKSIHKCINSKHSKTCIYQVQGLGHGEHVNLKITS